MTLHTTLHSLLLRCYTAPFRTKSDYARQHTNLVAMAASLGLITTFVPRRGFGNTWHLTKAGLEELNSYDYEEDQTTC